MEWRIGNHVLVGFLNDTQSRRWIMNMRLAAETSFIVLLGSKTFFTNVLLLFQNHVFHYIVWILLYYPLFDIQYGTVHSARSTGQVSYVFFSLRMSRRLSTCTKNVTWTNMGFLFLVQCSFAGSKNRFRVQNRKASKACCQPGSTPKCAPWSRECEFYKESVLEDLHNSLISPMQSAFAASVKDSIFCKIACWNRKASCLLLVALLWGTRYILAVQAEILPIKGCCHVPSRRLIDPYSKRPPFFPQSYIYTIVL